MATVPRTPILESEHRRAVRGWSLSVAAGVAIAAAAGWFAAPAPPRPAPVPVPVAVPVALPLPIATVTAAPAPVEPVDPEPDFTPAPLVREGTPRAWIGCEVKEAEICHDDFPAISADRKTIAVRWSDDDGGRGNPNFTIQLLRASDSKLIATHRLLTADEVDKLGYQETGEMPIEAIEALVGRRARRVQKVLDAGGYRSLGALGSSAGERYRRDDSDLRASFADDAVRVYAAGTGWSVYQEQFRARDVFGPVDPDSEEGTCTPTDVTERALWFAPEAKLLLVRVGFQAGPCFCGSETRFYVRRFERAPEPDTDL